MGKEKNKTNRKKTYNKKTSKPINKKEERIIDVEEEKVEEIIKETEEELDEEYDEDLEEITETEEDNKELDDNEDEDEELDDEDEDNEELDDDNDDDDDDDDDEDEDEDEEDEELDDEDEDDEELDDEDEDEDEDDEELDDDEDEDEDEELDDEDENEDEELDDEDEDEDEELDDEDEEIEEKEETVKIKQIKEEKKNKKEEQKNIKKIEKLAKKKNNKDSSFYKAFNTLDKYRYPIYTFIAGVLLTVLIAMLIWPDRIATLKDGTQPVVKVGGKTYTANNLYENMKNYYSVSLLLDQIDNDLLTKMYPEDEEMTKKIQENAEYYLNMYKQYYNYTQEQFLEKNGFSSYEAFLDYLRLDYRRGKYLDEYIEKNITDNEIKKYYDEKVFGDINTQHVLVEVKTNDEDTKKLSDEDAKKLAEEIITKINDGTKWDTIKKDYKDKVTFEDLGYQSWDASLEESFMTALKSMENNSFSKEPVKTSYGYHVIYRLDQKEKPSQKKVKDKIIEKIKAEKKSSDSDLQYKALISLRNEKKIKFSDTIMESKYETYCKKYK